MNDKELLEKLKVVFLQEAKERFNSILTKLIEIEQDDNPSLRIDIIDVIFRDVHSLKGASRSINLNMIEGLFQRLETIFGDIKNSKTVISKELLNLVQSIVSEMDLTIDERGIDGLNSEDIAKKLGDQLSTLFSQDLPKTKNKPDSISDFKSQPAEKTSIAINDIISNEPDAGEKITEKAIEKPDKNTQLQPKVGSSTVTLSMQDTVRISSSKLDSILLKSENLIQIKQMLLDNILLIENKMQPILTVLTNKTVLAEHEMIGIKQQLRDDCLDNQDIVLSIPQLKKIVVFMEDFSLSIKEINTIVKRLTSINKENHRNSEKLVDTFISDIKDIAMLPFSNILDIFPRMVKDISKELGKNINFHLVGDSIKIDRRILQEIKDPLIHLIRNSIDHGIESPEIRKILNKPEKGNISLSILQNESSKVDIVVEDDGEGIDSNLIRNKLIEKNIVTPEIAINLTEEEVIDYLFYSGFSMKDMITDISGRGLGLAIVKEKMVNLGAKISIKSKLQVGTKFKLTLPVVLATFKGILAKSNNVTFVIPSVSVERVISVPKTSLKKVENRDAVFYLDTTYPLVDSAQILNLPVSDAEDKKIEDSFISAAILNKDNKFIALKFDEIYEEQEILIKDLGKQLKKVPNVSGVTILNSGEIVPILNVQDVFYNSSNEKQPNIAVPVQKTGKAEKNFTQNQQKKKNILVVEDSITSRILLKNILDAAGYAVETAVDGLAGYTVLKSKNFDLIISDIEMPRMDGFELTAKVRADQKLASLPLILVTSRNSNEDKEKGIAVGANAYIMKGQFDQSNLLETINNLL